MGFTQSLKIGISAFKVNFIKMFVYKLKNKFNCYQNLKLKGRKNCNANFSKGFTPTPIMAYRDSANSRFLNKIGFLKLRYFKQKLHGAENLQYHNRCRGFSLIELMVSFAILTVGLTSGINLIGQGLKSSSYLKNQSMASYLAVEGIELVKNKRDENFLKKINWLQDLQSNCIASNACIIDPTNLASGINQCPNIGGQPKCPPLKYDTSANLFNYSTGLTTIFTRKITISAAADFGNEEREVISEVSWTDRFGPHAYILKDHILKWQ